jgi:hypothetical protein
MMDRRTFIGRVARGLLAVPFAANAQPTSPRRIGYLDIGSPAPVSSQLEAFRRS